MVLGIDNGVSGGWVILDDDQRIVRAEVMPLRSGVERRVDVRALATEWKKEDITYAGLERPSGSQSFRAIDSMARCYSAIRTVLELLGIAHEVVHCLSWQRTFWKSGTGNDTKYNARNAVYEIWPLQDWRASSRCKISHTGMVDAALIAEHIRRKLNRNQK